MAAPIITESHGQQSTTSSEANLFEVTSGTKYHETFINLKNQTVGDTFVFKTYIWDEQLGEYFIVKTDTLAGVPTPASLMIDMRCATRYKVTVQRTAGSDRVITWIRFQV